jgi:hypothetical protein
MLILLPLVTAATSDGELGTPEGITDAVAEDWIESPTVVVTAALNV